MENLDKETLIVQLKRKETEAMKYKQSVDRAEVTTAELQKKCTNLEKELEQLQNNIKKILSSVNLENEPSLDKVATKITEMLYNYQQNVEVLSSFVQLVFPGDADVSDALQKIKTENSLHDIALFRKKFDELEEQHGNNLANVQIESHNTIQTLEKRLQAAAQESQRLKMEVEQLRRELDTAHRENANLFSTNFMLKSRSREQVSSPIFNKNTGSTISPYSPRAENPVEEKKETINIEEYNEVLQKLDDMRIRNEELEKENLICNQKTKENILLIDQLNEKIKKINNEKNNELNWVTLAKQISSSEIQVERLRTLNQELIVEKDTAIRKFSEIEKENKILQEKVENLSKIPGIEGDSDYLRSIFLSFLKLSKNSRQKEAQTLGLVLGKLLRIDQEELDKI